MAICKICGATGANFHLTKHNTLCAQCDRDTPRKVAREEFDRIYWGGEGRLVPVGTRNEFWSDYLSSNLKLDKYIAHTTEAA